MKVTSVEKKEKSTVELTIQVEADAFEAAVQKAYEKERKNIGVPGFRKGKAPRKIIEGMYGSGVFYEDAINDLYPEAYAQAIEQEKLDAVAWPKVEIVDVGKEGLTFKALVTVRPEVKLGEYKGLTAEKAEVAISDEDVDNELKPFINRATRMVTVERAAETGDTVVIDFEGFLDGKPFDGGKAEGHSLELGSGSFVPGFEEQLVGAKAGDEKELNITFPEDYHAELAGKAVVFKVKVHEVKAKELPEVDDEFAKDVSEFDTLADFKKDLGEKLKERRETQNQRDFEAALMEQVMDNMEVEMEVTEQPGRQIDLFAIPGMEEMGSQMKGLFSKAFPPKQSRRKLKVKDAYKILLQEESEKLVDENTIIETAKKRTEQMGIVFIDEIDKIASTSQNRSSDVSREGVQRDLLPIVEGCSVNTKYGIVHTDHILFISAGAFHFSKPSDLIPELQGRFPLRVELDALGRNEFLRILKEPDNALTKQYAALLNTENVRLSFTDDGLEEIAAFAEEINSHNEDIGARRLYTIMEKVLADVSFDAPDMPGAQVMINRDYVREHLTDVREDQDLSRYIL